MRVLRSGLAVPTITVSPIRSMRAIRHAINMKVPADCTAPATSQPGSGADHRCLVFGFPTEALCLASLTTRRRRCRFCYNRQGLAFREFFTHSAAQRYLGHESRDFAV